MEQRNLMILSFIYNTFISKCEILAFTKKRKIEEETMNKSNYRITKRYIEKQINSIKIIFGSEQDV